MRRAVILLTFGLLAGVVGALDARADDSSAEKEQAFSAPTSSIRVGRSLSRIAHLRISTSRTALGEPSPSLPQGTKAVFCNFDARNISSGTSISVRWRKAGSELTRSDFNNVQGTTALTADMSSNVALPSGDYTVEVRINGTLSATTTFAIAAPTIPQGNASSSGSRDNVAGPRVTNLSLSPRNCLDHPGGAQQPGETLRGVAHSVHLCLDFDDVEEGQALEVRWFNDTSPRRPLAVTSYSPSGGGSLSSAYTYETGPLPSGGYYVTVTLDGSEVARASFSVER